MGIIDKASLQKIENIRKQVLKGAIWILIGSVVAGVFVILFADPSSRDMVGRFIGTLFVVALAMLISSNNFRRLADDSPAVSSFALVGLVSNLAWLVLCTILIWVPDLALVCTHDHYGCSPSILAKIGSLFIYLSALGLINSNTLAIYEGDKKSMIRPLKITVVACVSFETLYFCFVTFFGLNVYDEIAQRFAALAGFVGFVWVALVITALVLSKGEKKRESAKVRQEQTKKAEAYDKAQAVSAGGASENGGTPAPKSEAELRAEIEEKVRREMIEKEVREKLEAERKNKED